MIFCSWALFLGFPEYAEWKTRSAQTPAHIKALMYPPRDRSLDTRVLEVAHVPRYHRHATCEREMAALRRKTSQASRINVYSRTAQHQMCGIARECDERRKTNATGVEPRFRPGDMRLVHDWNAWNWRRRVTTPACTSVSLHGPCSPRCSYACDSRAEVTIEAWGRFRNRPREIQTKLEVSTATNLQA